MIQKCIYLQHSQELKKKKKSSYCCKAFGIFWDWTNPVDYTKITKESGSGILWHRRPVNHLLIMSNVKAPISLWNGLCPITTNILCSKTICWSWAHCQTQIVLGCNSSHCTTSQEHTLHKVNESQRWRLCWVTTCSFICCDASKWFLGNKQSFSLKEKRRAQHKLQAERMSLVSQYAPLQRRRTCPVSNGVFESLLSPSRPSFVS